MIFIYKELSVYQNAHASATLLFFLMHCFAVSGSNW